MAVTHRCQPKERLSPSQ